MKPEFTFNEDMIKLALKANGYYEHYGDYWAHNTDNNPDIMLRTTMMAFTRLLYKSNLISKEFLEG